MKAENNIQLGKNGMGLKIGLILPFFNEELSMELYENTAKELKELEAEYELYRVPGAMELPLTAKKLALSKKYDAIIALGLVIRGETSHYAHVCAASIDGCMQVQLETLVPVINGILTVENIEQAKERIQASQMNKGKEFAQSAVFMANQNI